MNRQSTDFSVYVKEEIGRVGLHSDIKLDSDGVVKIRRHDTRADESHKDFAVFDLKIFWLPPNDIYDLPTSLLSRDDLTCAIILFLNDFMFRTRSSKGRHDRARVQARQCIKFFEYFWMLNYLQLSSVPHNFMHSFAKEISQIGWTGILNIKARIDTVIFQGPGSVLSKREFASALATNIDGSDFGLIFKHYMSRFSEEVRLELITQPLGYSSMRHLLGALNNLHGLAGGIGLKQFPYLNSLALCRALTSTPLRTPNIGPKDAASLFAGSFEIILSLADRLVLLLENVSNSVIDNFKLGRFELGSNIEGIVLEAGMDKLIPPNKIGKGNSSNTGGNYVCGLILLLMSACFVVLAVCNARRRDEIQHKKYGVHYGCATIMNEELGLYVSEFYIEKTLLDYSVFFINGISYRAIKVLELIQDQFAKVDRALGREAEVVSDRERNLFSYRRLGEREGIGQELCWFSFSDTRRGYVARFFDYIFPMGHSLDVSAHMFRRLYGLLFMYRHELPEVQALSYQYQHDCFTATVTYITDPAVEGELNSIFNLYGVNPANARKSYTEHCEDLEESLLDIAKDRMAELVEYTLSGGNGRGGFTKFLKAVYKKYLNSVEFVNLTSNEQTKVISDRFVSRGHLPNPFRHSLCVASPSRQSTSARCSSPVTKALRPELASPTVCHGCPFQYLNEYHIKNMIQDHAHLLSELGRSLEGSTTAQRLVGEIANLGRIIQFHDERKTYE
ncbi:hypothetical protein [Pseudomonas fluorescens]|uniref:hypothetical protein n=1 Tax=Pseudomonas fluorescens TaxID=294 RepID=UPI0011CE6865|nr:hypothetical protein [Pseudomonas fluorescens]